MELDYLQRVLTSRVYDVAVETPLVRAPQLSSRLGTEVLLKREDRVLCGIQVPPGDLEPLRRSLEQLGYPHRDVSEDPAYRLFLG